MSLKKKSSYHSSDKQSWFVCKKLVSYEYSYFKLYDFKI